MSKNETEKFNPFDAGITIMPGDDNTFLVVEGDYDRERDGGFRMRRRWGFSSADDLLQWLQSHPRKLKTVA